MRICKLAVYGATVFDKRVELDFERIPDGLVALAGPNGSGKTTLLDGIIGALYRTFPTRPGNMIDAFRPVRDGYIELVFEYEGHRYRSRILVDAIARKTEAFLDVQSEPPLTAWAPLVSGKVSDFDRWVAKHLPPLEMVLASVFCPQNRAGNFLELPVVDRKRLFVRLLGLDKLEVLSQMCRNVADILRQATTALVGQFKGIEDAKDDLEQRHGRQDVLAKNQAANDADLAEARQVVTRCETEVETLKQHKALALAEQDHEQAMDRLATSNRRRRDAHLGETSREVATRREGIARMVETRDTNVALASNRDAIEQAVRDAAGLQVERKALHLALTKAQGRLDEALVQQTAQVTLEGSLAATKADVTTHTKMAATLARVPCAAGDDPYAGCEFLSMGHRARQALPQANRLLAATRKTLVDMGDSREAVGLARSVVDEARGAVAHRDDQMDGLAALVVQAEPLARALDMAEHLAGQVEDSGSALARYQQSRAHALGLLDSQDKVEQDDLVAVFNEVVNRLGPVAPTELTPDEADVALADAGGEVADLEKARDSLLAEVGRVAGVVEQTEQAIEKAQVAWNHHDRLMGRTGAFVVLARAFGKDGLQALAIDAAGPAVSKAINELLGACYGDRFVVQIRTQKLKRQATKAQVADGSAFKEDFDIVVRDNEAGRDAAAKDLSGGERVIISEAIALGLAVFNTQRAGMDMRTLIRDETCGALDSANADRYVRMLRLAKRSGNFERVLFVSHQEAVTRQADAVVQVHELRAPADAVLAGNPFD